ncbi:hypothetical protein [Desulfotalea psychrophila]|nr:hypothetical protein [Desulfotalea psychrophila]
MNITEMSSTFTPEALNKIFPAKKADEFFDALFGDASEGAYDIQLAFAAMNENQLEMALQLQQRPGRCLACNLTHGLPQVFSRHPLLNIAGVVKDLGSLLGDSLECGEWSLGHTEQRSAAMHVIPLKISLKTI